MYSLYLKKYEPEHSQQIDSGVASKPLVTYDFYARHFNQKHNLSFGQPKSDTCQKCDEFSKKIDAATENDKNVIIAERNIHQANAEVFYKEMKEKTLESKNDPSTETICFDFQQNLPVPVVPSGDLFYMRQMWVFPFCIHIGSTGKSYFYTYDEINGRKSQNEVITCLNSFLSTYIKVGTLSLYIFSDNCASQNKNMILTYFYHTLVGLNRFEKIVHRYPEPGHSFMPCDRSFGLVEKQKRKIERIHLPQEWNNVIRNTSRNFIVSPMKREDFIDFKLFFDSQYLKSPFAPVRTGGEKFMISKYRIMEFNRSFLEGVRVSKNASGLVCTDFFIKRKSNVTISLPNSITHPLYKENLKLKDAKLKDVLKIAEKYLSTSDFDFYKMINNTDSVSDGNCDDSSTDDGELYLE